MPHNTVQELPVTLQEIRIKEKIDKYITEKRKQISSQHYIKNDGESFFSICDEILMCGERVVIPEALKKKNT